MKTKARRNSSTKSITLFVHKILVNKDFNNLLKEIYMENLK